MPFYAIDLFCGAGGFSEGILQAGFEIVFSSDRSKEVQQTYMNRHEQLGLIQDVNTHFELADIKDLTADRILECINQLPKFKNNHTVFKEGDIDAIFGGPPCQGFSRAGKRDANDPRNMLFHEYLRIIKDLKPKYVVMENVEGFMDMCMLDFPSVFEDGIFEGQQLVKDILTQELKELGYSILEPEVVNASNFGVPQNRRRAVFLASRMDMPEINYPEPTTPTVQEKVTVHEALSGLVNEDTSPFGESSILGRTPAIDGSPISSAEFYNIDVSNHSISVKQRFSLYRQGESTRDVSQRLRRKGIDLRNNYPELFFETLFQVNKDFNKVALTRIMDHLGINNAKFEKDRWLGDTNKILGILEIPGLKKAIYSEYFNKLSKRLMINEEMTRLFLENCQEQLNQPVNSRSMAATFKHGKNITNEMLEALFTRKNSRRRLDPNGQAPTMVTLPDDFIHPYENRILTVREMARFQSFDDSFVFLGKRTTGGEKRKEEVPQYTQVGNAVPPLLARAIAQQVFESLRKSQQ